MGRQVARQAQGWAVVVRAGERKLRRHRRAHPLQRRGGCSADVLPALPRRLGARRRERRQHHPKAALPLLIRSTLWAADLANSGPPPSLSVEELARSQASLVAQAMGPEGDLVVE